MNRMVVVLFVMLSGCGEETGIRIFDPKGLYEQEEFMRVITHVLGADAAETQCLDVIVSNHFECGRADENLGAIGCHTVDTSSNCGIIEFVPLDPCLPLTSITHELIHHSDFITHGEDLLVNDPHYDGFRDKEHRLEDELDNDCQFMSLSDKTEWNERARDKHNKIDPLTTH